MRFISLLADIIPISILNKIEFELSSTLTSRMMEGR